MGPATNCSITSAKTKWILLPTAPPSIRSTSKPANGACMMYKHNSCNLCRRKPILRLLSAIHCWPPICNRQANPNQNKTGWLYWRTSIRMSDVSLFTNPETVRQFAHSPVTRLGGTLAVAGEAGVEEGIIND